MPFDQNFGPGEGPAKQSRTIWDMGPPRPVLPTQTRPTAPDANLAGAERVEAWETYERQTVAYEQGRRSYMDAKHAYDEWHAANPVYPAKRLVAIIDAKEAVERDPGRYQFYFPEAPASDGAKAA